MYKSLSQFSGTLLTLATEKWYKSDYFLNDETDTYGKLSPVGKWKSDTRAELAGASFRFTTKGWWRWVRVITDDRDQEVGRFTQNWSGRTGTLILADGREILFRCKGFWQSIYEWEEPSKGRLLTVTPRGWSGKSYEVEIPDRQHPRIPLLLVFSMYLVLQARKQAASGAATAS